MSKASGFRGQTLPAFQALANTPDAGWFPQNPQGSPSMPGLRSDLQSSPQLHRRFDLDRTMTVNVKVLGEAGRHERIGCSRFQC
jgi:hypothetical protein